MPKKLATKGIIFDFDGVLVDSLSVHLMCWTQSYLEFYNEILTDTNGLAGRSTKAISEILALRAKKPATAQELAELKRQKLRESSRSIVFLPGALDSINWLKSNQVPFGIASNAPKAFIEQTLSNLGLSVDYYFGIEDVAAGKPAPDVFLKCARAIGLSVLDHKATIVFEDSAHGISACVKAGMLPVGVLSQDNVQDLINAGAISTCANLLEAKCNDWLQFLPLSKGIHLAP
jgi:beta-phosphoglucomutase